MNSVNYSISLCICTMNRSEDLARCLGSIFKGVEQPDEIIVSDDSPNGEPTQNVVEKYPSVIYQKGPQQGLGPNRNACIRSATSSYIMFIDDDVCVPLNCFAIARQLMTTCEPKTIITGHEMNHGGGGRWDGEVRKIVPQNADFWGLQRVPIDREYRAIVINSTIFPRSLFERARFDENLRYGSEEIDMARHAVALGYHIAYEDSFYVEHYPSLTNREQYKQFVHASRLYATAKAYWQYERSVFKTLAYLLLAPLQLTGSALRRGNLRDTWGAVKATALAVRYLLMSRKNSVEW
jgi:GT2 family glycosyltransferase